MSQTPSPSRPDTAVQPWRLRRCLLPALLALLLTAPAAQSDQAADVNPIEPAAIADLTEGAMQAFDVPGMAVGVVARGKVLYAAGHGIRELGQPGRVDERTLFRIASASKAFTSAALAILVDQGKVGWDEPVIDHLPELRMHDPWVTANISVTDLLAHRSGLPPHAGDILLWPVPNAFSREDVIHALRYFPLQRGFRAGYSYDNVLYIVAGEIVARASGVPWGAFVDQNIMRPLGMTRCFAGPVPAAEMHNLAAPHGKVDGELVIIDRNRVPAEPDKFAPAGGVVCSLADLLRWVGLQLGQGTSAEGVSLFSAEQSRKMFRPHNWLGVGEQTFTFHRTLFSAYGLGWRIRDVHGYREVSHTGSLDGLRSHVLMIPELQLGIVVLANGSSSAARSAVMYGIEQAFLPGPGRDWIRTYLALEEEERQQAEAASAERTEPAVRAPSLPFGDYVGRYRDSWFGEVDITGAGDALYFSAAKSPRLSGPLQHYSGDVFVVRWTDRSLEMDAYVRFHPDESGRVRSMTLRRITGDESSDPDHYAFLDFSRVE